MGWRLLRQRLPQNRQGEKPKADSVNSKALALRRLLRLARQNMHKEYTMDIYGWLAFVAAGVVSSMILGATITHGRKVAVASAAGVAFGVLGAMGLATTTLRKAT